MPPSDAAASGPGSALWIGDAGRADADDIVRLFLARFPYRSVMPRWWTRWRLRRDVLRRLGDRMSQTMIARRDGRLVAVLRARVERDAWHIDSLCTDPDVRRHATGLWIEFIMYWVRSAAARPGPRIGEFHMLDPRAFTIYTRMMQRHGFRIETTQSVRRRLPFLKTESLHRIRVLGTSG